ncbi:nucleotide exchange factor GrpE [Bifidobacterium sp. SO4]|uniref:nucleotide exchange factor GrpE n=1 Tax=Bifidobacterium sp. SO4 TaxID=2809030 RepID=UPI001BDC4C22|nr:nucleotide exchange factor GrpE [Bifidobacterium sp. SO4]MBT1169700.1 nucleotide exchange factor GrpE [Bifidobacterium sp. SO4]
MSDFNKDDYLNDLPDADDLAAAKSSTAGTAASEGGSQPETANTSAPSDEGAGAATAATEGEKPANAGKDNDSAKSESDSSSSSDDDTLTPLGKAKKEAADYLEALQRERAEFINYRNRATREQERFRQHGIIDVLTALLPALDDIDRIREHSEMDDSFKAVAAKIDKAFEKFGVEKFGEKGETFDPTKHDAILHKPDPNADKETVDTVVEAGYRIGDRVIRAARVVVASPQN